MANCLFPLKIKDITKNGIYYIEQGPGEFVNSL